MKYKARTLARLRAKRRLNANHHINHVIALSRLNGWFPRTHYNPMLGAAVGEMGRFVRREGGLLGFKYRDYLEEICK